MLAACKPKFQSTKLRYSSSFTNQPITLPAFSCHFKPQISMNSNQFRQITDLSADANIDGKLKEAFEKGSAYLKLKKYTPALQIFNEILKRKPNFDPAVYVNKASIFLAAKKIRTSRTSYFVSTRTFSRGSSNQPSFGPNPVQYEEI